MLENLTNQNKIRWFAILAVAICLFTSVFILKVNKEEVENHGVKAEATIKKDKILFVDSYHIDYEWSRGITAGVKRMLNTKYFIPESDDKIFHSYRNQKGNLELRIFRMDTKHSTSEEYKKNVALQIKEIIDTWKPDLVIASDDNANQYLISKYYIDADIPVVFCGVNWDCSHYGFPASNITGMVEVAVADKLVEKLLEYAEGQKVGILYPDNFSERQHVEFFQKNLNIQFEKAVGVQTFDEWKKAYTDIQKDVDVLLLTNNAGISGWDRDDAVDFVNKNTSIPTGTFKKWMLPFCMMNYDASPDEQGEYAAVTALKILNGKSPADIPIVTNTKVSNIYLNHDLARRAGIVFKNDLLELEKNFMNRGRYSYEETRKKDYTGVTLDVLTHDMSLMGETTVLHARQFEELTNCKINVHHVPFGDLHQETILGLRQDKYDVLIYGSLWIADMQKHLAPVPNEMLKSPHFEDVMDHYKNIAKWGDRTYQVNIDGDRHYFKYRRDIMSNPQYKNEYRQKFGKELTVPKTWKEANKLAAFFHGKTLENGETIYGMSDITNKDGFLFTQFIKRAAPYAKHPDVKGGFYFDLRTMKPLINTPGFVEALKDFIESTKYHIPNRSSFSIADIIKDFGDGKTVFLDSWDDSFVYAMRKKSKVYGKLATSLSLGSRKVWNRKTKQWDSFPDVNHVPYYAWGWTSAVAKRSQNVAASFDFLGFFCNSENHFSDLQVSRYGVNPVRNADIRADFWIEKVGWEKVAAESYAQTLQEMSRSTNNVIDLRIHQGRQYMEALAVGVSRALTGREKPQQALDKVAERWEIITERVGRDKQRSAYSHVVRFEDNNE